MVAVAFVNASKQGLFVATACNLQRLFWVHTNDGFSLQWLAMCQIMKVQSFVSQGPLFRPRWPIHQSLWKCLSNEFHTALCSLVTSFETCLPLVTPSLFSIQYVENSSEYQKLCPNSAVAASVKEGTRGSMVMLATVCTGSAKGGRRRPIEAI